MVRDKKYFYQSQIEQAIEADDLLRVIMHNSPALISAKDLSGTVIMANESFRHLHEDGPEVFIGKSVFDLFAADIAQELWANDLQAAKEGRKIEIEEQVFHSDGTLHTYFTIKFPLYNSYEELFATCAISIDITDRKKAEQASIQDELTGLLNRRSFNSRFGEERRRAQRDESWLTLMMIDVDHFKKYNDHYGHHFGDEALKKLAAIMEQTFQRPADHIFRIGGEEFAVLFPSNNLEHVQAISEQLRQKVADAGLEHRQNPPDYRLTISIGAYAIHFSDPLIDDEIYHLADQQLYRAKSSGRNCVCLASSPLD